MTVRLPSIADAAKGLAPLHGRWLEAVLGGEIPSEPHATCESCAMLPVSGGADDHRDAIFFNPRTKCCTYLPKLPNFLVGAILADEAADMAEGRARVLERIGKKVGVTPLHVRAGRAHNLAYDHRDGVFGQSEAMRCPYYVEDRIGGECGIWRHRNSVCMTWFCKHERGALAKRFWDSAEELLMAVEDSLATHCLLTLGFDDAALRVNFPLRGSPGDELDGTVSHERYTSLWGRWTGREEELFHRCDALVRDLEWKDVERIGGATVALHSRLARAAYQATTRDALPERLEIGCLNVIGAGHGTVRLATYSAFDPIDAPAALLPALPAFDGSKVSEALRAIEKDHGLVLHRELVQKLVDYGLLRAVDVPGAGDERPQPTSRRPRRRARTGVSTS